jgi:hypothetical protein
MNNCPLRKRHLDLFGYECPHLSKHDCLLWQKMKGMMSDKRRSAIQKWIAAANKVNQQKKHDKLSMIVDVGRKGFFGYGWR